MLGTVGLIVGGIAAVLWIVGAIITWRYEKTHMKRQPVAVIGQIDSMEMTPEGLFMKGRWRDGPPERLVWAVWPWQQCRARANPNVSGFHGRCELVKHGPEIDHALERGFDIPRWSTEWTDY